MNIPEKAIEAAARRIYEQDGGEDWHSRDGDMHFAYKLDAEAVLRLAAPFIAAQAAKAERERIAEEIHIQRFNKSGPNSFYWGITTAERIACDGDHPGMIHAQAVRAIEEAPNA